MSRALRLLPLLLVLIGARASAHPLEFGVLSLDERRDGAFELELRFSGGEEGPRDGAPWLDRGCRLDDPIEVPLDWGVHLRGVLVCEGGLVGKRVGVVGLAGSDVEVSTRVRFRSGDVQTALLSGDAPRLRVRPQASSLEVLRSYVVLGAEHIAIGLDHLLLVFGLLLASRSLRELVATVTSFTLGHSLTLALASLGLVHVPGPPVEACIALSLVLLAIELVREDEGGPRARPWLLAVVFGLLHGLGFAGALAEVGLPQGALGVALLGFNLGVEAGQLAFVAVVLALAALLRRLVREPLRLRVRRHLPEALGALSTFFLIERLLALGS